MKIGLRIPGAASALPFPVFCKWCAESGFQAVDIGKVTPDTLATLKAAGLQAYSVDLPFLGGLFGDDNEAAATITEANAAIEAAGAAGIRCMFTLLLPTDGARGRAAHFSRLTETFGPIVECAERNNVRLAVEGWPGPGPYYPTLACTPETVRALLKAFPSQAVGINYDPSHLIRIGVDHIRFLREFGDRVVHCHGKDAVFDSEALYLHGNLGRTFGSPKAFGEDWWRYCIPGEGEARWPVICATLDSLGFDGCISVELEDFRYTGTWEVESEGLLRARNYLAGLV